MIFWPESLLKGDSNLLARAAAASDCPKLAGCSRSAIQHLAQREGIDFATALIFDRVLRQPANRDFFERMQCQPEVRRGEPPLIGLVPGAFYREHNNTGADGAEVTKILEAIGCRVERVPVASFGSLAENAKTISNWLSLHHRERVALFSLSKGSADVKAALTLSDAGERFQNVAAWVSVSGLPQGTPLVGWLRQQMLRRLGVRLLLWSRGQRYSVVEELRDEPDGPLASWPTLPPHLRICHVVSFSLQHHLTHRWAPRAYERVKSLGPNDGGGFLLADVATLPGVVVPVWGADHYLQPAWDVASLLRRVFTAALSPPTKDFQANQSAAQPNNPPASKSTA
jgi:hypothetical protein